MDSPVDQALAAFAPVPPPPISSSGNRPFPRSLLTSAEACTCGGSLIVTPRSTRDGPSPSWVSLTASTDGYATPPPPLHLSAPPSQDLEVSVQPPPMPRMYGLTTSSPFLTVSPSRRALKALRRSASTGATTATTAAIITPRRNPAPPLRSSTSPLAWATAEGRGDVSSVFSRDNFNTSTTERNFVRSDSLPTSTDIAAASEAPSPSQHRVDGAAGLLAASPYTNTAPGSFLCGPTGTAHLRGDQQPALPQRIHQTPLSLFVDCVVTSHNGSPVLHHTVGGACCDSSSAVSTSSLALSRNTPSTSSSEVTPSRVWGGQRGPHCIVTGPREVTALWLEAGARVGGERPSSAAQRTRAPAPPPPLPPSPAGVFTLGGAGGVGAATAATGTPSRRPARHVLSPPVVALSSEPILTDGARGDGLSADQQQQQQQRRLPVRAADPAATDADVADAAAATAPRAGRLSLTPLPSSSCLVKAFRHIKDVSGYSNSARSGNSSQVDGARLAL